MGQEYFHSVTLDRDKCKGCTNCIKHCPTEAIRVRNGKAEITKQRCIDCGNCIRVCPYHAKKAVTDPMSILDGWEYRVALPAPSLYAQFGTGFERGRILAALLRIGFDDVFEVATAAEIISRATERHMTDPGVRKPVISSACPAVVRLIQVRFPSLIDNLLRMDSPMELAARMARLRAHRRTGIPMERIGTFFLSPCAAKMTAVRVPYGKETSDVSGVFSMKELHLPIFEQMKKMDAGEGRHLTQSGGSGLYWACSGGESDPLGQSRHIAVHGIENIIEILEEAVEERLEGVDFIEALSCTEGCLGGPLTVENPFVSKVYIRKMILNAGTETDGAAQEIEAPESFEWTRDMNYMPVLKLDDDMMKALEMLARIDALEEALPGLDCGACGAPSCRALAEDIVRGFALETDCVFKLREKMVDLEHQINEQE